MKLKVYLHGENINEKDLRVIEQEVDTTSLFASKLPTAWRDTINNLE